MTKDEIRRDEIRRQELSDFLRNRRGRIAPADVGLPATIRRRTPGLRREEVAQLAGMSATWYTWLEQKRPIGVSSGVLDNLARVLLLDPAERLQLFQLALRQPVLNSTSKPETVSPLIRRIIDQMDPIPALVIGRRWDVLAWNRGARAFFLDFEQVPANERNMLWLLFTNPALRSLVVDWRERAQDTLARFRADYGRHAGDAHFVQLVERLKSVSPEFAEWWPRFDIQPMSEGRREYDHPMGGRMIVEHATFLVGDNPELGLLVFNAAAASNSIAKMEKIVAAFRTGAPYSSSSHRERKPRNHLRRRKSA
ncbi:MAG TPA: helix-turn-helix transcriptional regulator [Candidatus Dormibacteraeota bacterium]|nr:helix-turn-helix transcriptional regulator [Candidatus Dormibacteraeota bacterium]